MADAFSGRNSTHCLQPIAICLGSDGGIVCICEVVVAMGVVISTLGGFLASRKKRKKR